MSKILVTYATMAGSTEEVAQAIGEEIGKSGIEVDVIPIGEVKDLGDYAGVVVGAPMIMASACSSFSYSACMSSLMAQSPSFMIHVPQPVQGSIL